MDELKTMLIRDACRQLLMRYARAVDTQDIDLFLTVYAEECEWKRQGKPPMRNHADIREFFKQIWAKYDATPHGVPKRHNFTTVCIEPVDEETATGTAYAIVYTAFNFAGAHPAPMPVPEFVMEYHHVFKKTAKGWRIARQDATYVFSSGGELPGNAVKLPK